MAKRKRTPYLDQAKAAALVKYGPEISGLLELQRQAQQNLSGGVAAAKGSAAAITNAIDTARPQVEKVYRDATAQQGVIAAGVASHLGGLGGVANSINAAATSEAGAAASRIGESKAAALTSLSQQRVGAQEGRQFAVQQARQAFATDVGKVGQRRQDLLHEAGAYTAATRQDLKDKARAERVRLQINASDNAVSTANNIRSTTQSDINSRRAAADKKKAAGKPKVLAPGDMATAIDQYGSAATWAQQYAAKGVPLEKARQALTNGLKPQPIYEDVKDATGKVKRQKKIDQKTGVPLTTGTIPQFKSQLLLQAALEVAYNGRLSKKTQNLLRRRGLDLKALGAPLAKKRDTGAVRPQTGTMTG